MVTTNQEKQTIHSANGHNKSGKTILPHSCSLPRERKYTGCSPFTERATPVAKKNHKNAKIMEMHVYLVFIFTWLLISVPNEQKSSTLMHFFDDQGFQANFFLFCFYVFL
jgi:hypothetical protein